MSDYLWDKSGDPDPAIERLEELLARRRYAPEPLRLPSAEPSPVARSFRPRLVAALAACAVLAILGGVWVFTTGERANTQTMPVAANDLRRENVGGTSEMPRASGAEAARPGEVRPRLLTRAPRVAATRGTRIARFAAHEPHGITRDARGSRHAPPGDGAAGVTAATDARIPAEQRRAKQELMLALRLASRKLNVARDMTRGERAADGGSR